MPLIFTALPSNRPINLIGVCHLLLIGQANRCKWKPFTHNFCGRSSSTWSLWSPSKGFDGAIKIEDKALKSMLESLPLHGGLPRNPCYAKIIDLNFVTFRCHGVLEMVWLFSSWASCVCARYNWSLCARFLHISSHSMQVKAVITVRYHVKVMKTTKELDY
jgi:hypothetical protein